MDNSTNYNVDGQEMREENKLTITDVAEALGISKTTVSRAISGKGRIGEATRNKVMEYIRENNYKPNPIAKGLAKSKTYNIGWVMPGDTTVTDLPFFQRCMMGAVESAIAADYDVLISMVYDHDMSQLERVVKNRKLDGVILARTLVEDDRIRFLKESEIPFVVVGSSNEDEVVQIDNDHISACSELTAILVMKGIKKMVLIGGPDNQVVNVTRRDGFVKGLEAQNANPDEIPIHMNCETEKEIERVVDEILKTDIRCIVCTDDRICYMVLAKLRKEGITVPKDMKVASFYNSAIIESNQPPITAIQYDPKELGTVACRTLIDILNEKEVPKKNVLGYEVMLKASTQ
jgi:DNA-binding LacI/PurR family transcriptional regulator